MTADVTPPDARRAVRGEVARPSSLPAEHQQYFSDILGGLYCKVDGEPAPCLHNRQLWEAQQDRAIRCLCSHALAQHHGGSGQCWVAACGCASMRPKQVTA